MGAFQILWRLLSANQLSQLGNDVAKLQHDGSVIADDFKAWMLQGVKLATDIKTADTDITPIVKMLQALKG